MSKDTEKKELEKKVINTKKWLYYFEVPRKRLQKVKEEKTDEEGKKFTIEKEEEVEAPEDPLAPEAESAAETGEPAEAEEVDTAAIS